MFRCKQKHQDARKPCVNVKIRKDGSPGRQKEHCPRHGHPYSYSEAAYGSANSLPIDALNINQAGARGPPRTWDLDRHELHYPAYHQRSHYNYQPSSSSSLPSTLLPQYGSPAPPPYLSPYQNSLSVSTLALPAYASRNRLPDLGDNGRGRKQRTYEHWTQESGLCEQISDKMSVVLTAMDEEKYDGDENSLGI